ncbi:ATP synthase F1 subunit epsilon [Acidocella sp. MX-AZ03]|uniref:ATP synthase F1 subunit epsilon n=1 Tax=Acidocella TaxID=50709 RepID=UPI00047CF6E2|nr:MULTISPECIES: ATP synthase F1 subunit epsilon [Acidocella]WBO60606.1 ATP synthase F1 subunit epsilon [Acidocella sp. MX-AZ03]
MPLALEIISPERLLLAREVDMVVVPGTEGDLGILPGHSKLVTSLRGGLVDIYEAGKITDRFFVTGGFAEVTEGRCSVLADEIIRQADLDPAAAQAKLAEAEAAFAAVNLQDADAYREASDTLISAQAMVDSVALAPAA